MKRLPSNQGNFTPHPEGEPDFYMISSLHPLPPQAITSKDAIVLAVSLPISASSHIPVLLVVAPGEILGDPKDSPCSKVSKQEEASQSMPHVQAYDWNNTAYDWNNINYTHEEEYDDYTQACHEGEEEDSFCDTMNAFIDSFQV